MGWIGRIINRTLLNKMSLWLILFITVTSYAQNYPHSYNEHHEWGFTLGVNQFFDAKLTSDKQNTITEYKHLGTKNFTAGIFYDYRLNSDWSVKGEIKMLLFGDSYFIDRGVEDLYSFSSGSDIDLLLKFPISIMYNHAIRSRLSIDLGGGFGITYYDYTYLRGAGGIMENTASFESNYSNNSNPYYTSIHLELGLGIEANNTLLQPKLIYNHSFKPFRKGIYQFANLPDEPDFGGTLEQSGSFIGVHLGIRFKKKNKSVKIEKAIFYPSE